jgi:predicted RecA/RadA family phage recombinase
MALNEIYAVANSLVLPVHADVNSGDLVQVGKLIGVAEHDAKAGEDGNKYATLKLTGAFEFPIKSGVTTLAPGSLCYGNDDATTGVISEVNATNTDKLVGHVIKVRTGFAVVRLVQGA